MLGVEARRVAVIGGIRIPFCRAHTSYARCSNQDMMTAVLQARVIGSGTYAAVDSNSNLYVADGCNARVLRFPAPFAQPAGMPQANLVLGQPGFFGQPIKDLSRSTMARISRPSATSPTTSKVGSTTPTPRSRTTVTR